MYRLIITPNCAEITEENLLRTVRDPMKNIYLDRDDLGDVDTWPHSEYPVQWVGAMGGWGDLQLNTASADVTGASLII